MISMELQIHHWKYLARVRTVSGLSTGPTTSRFPGCVWLSLGGADFDSFSDHRCISVPRTLLEDMLVMDLTRSKSARLIRSSCSLTYNVIPKAEAANASLLDDHISAQLPHL
jgi:hypothetical protein